MRPASFVARSVPRWRWLWQHCLDQHHYSSHHYSSHSRTFALRVRTNAARFPSQPRVAPSSKPTPPTTPPSSRTRPARVCTPSATSLPLARDTATAATSAQLALVEAEKAHQPDTALELLPLVDQQTSPLTSSQPDSHWTEHLSSATAFESAVLSFAQKEQWSSLLTLYLAHPFHHPLLSVSFTPSTSASQLAIEAAMELRDWDKVLRVHVRTVVYEHRRQERGEDAGLKKQPVTATTKPSRSIKYSDRAAAASSASAFYRVHACLDCVLYSAYRLGRHDLVLSLFNVRTTPLPSSHTTYILSCAQTQQWQRVEQWLASVEEAVWEEVEMAAVHTVMTAWRLAFNQQTHLADQNHEQEQHRYHQSVALIAEWMMRVGAMSTPPQPAQWSADFRIQRVVDGPHSSFPLLIRPMLGYVSPLLVSALSTTTHYSEVGNMEAIITLTLLRMRSHLLSSPAPLLFSIYIQPPHSSLTSWDVDTAVEALGIRGMSAFVRGSEMRAVMGGSEKRRAEEAKRREESRELFESKGERRRRRMEEEAVKRGEMEEEKQWVLEIDVETMQRWMTKTMLPWERESLSVKKQQHEQKLVHA